MLHRLVHAGSRFLPQVLRWRVKSWLGLSYSAQHPELDLVDFTRGSRTILDVGACRGGFAGDILLRAPLSSVHSFEANPDVWSDLKMNCAAYGRLRGVPRATPHCLAVGNEIGPRVFTARSFAAASSFLDVGEAHRKGYPACDTAPHRSVSVEMTTLQRFAAENGMADCKLLKVDVEGYELEVLRGAGSFLDRVEYVLCEVEFSRLYEGAPLWTDVVAWLQGRGFVPLVLGGLCFGPGGEALQGDLLAKNARVGNRIPR